MGLDCDALHGRREVQGHVRGRCLEGERRQILNAAVVDHVGEVQAVVERRTLGQVEDSRLGDQTDWAKSSVRT